MIAIPNMEKPKNTFGCSTKINPEERMCIYTGKVFEETLSLLLARPCDDCSLIEIVECKDCKWAKKEGDEGEGNLTCACHIPRFIVPSNGFCYLGKRRE